MSVATYVRNLYLSGIKFGKHFLGQLASTTVIFATAEILTSVCITCYEGGKRCLDAGHSLQKRESTGFMIPHTAEIMEVLKRNAAQESPENSIPEIHRGCLRAGFFRNFGRESWYRFGSYGARRNGGRLVRLPGAIHSEKEGML